MMTILTISGISAAVILAIAMAHHLTPPQMTPMTDAWMRHMELQLTKPGGPAAAFQDREDRR